MKKYLLFITFFIFTSNFCFAQKKIKNKKVYTKISKVKKVKSNKNERVTEFNEEDKRKIKYLCFDGTNIVVFFDNGKAGVTNEFAFCQENLSQLFKISTPYVYEILKLIRNEPIMSYKKSGDETAEGIYLSKDWWFIKDFGKVKEINKCK